MHIVVIDTTLTTPPTGGAHTFLVDLTQLLVRRNWKLSIVTQPGPEAGILSALQESGAEVIVNLWNERHLPEEKAPRLASWVNGCHPDVYVVSASPDVGWLALPLLDSSIATFSIAHNDVDAFYEPLKHYQPFVDCAIGVSQTTYNRIIERCSVPPERVRHIPYGVRSLSAEEVLALSRDKTAECLKIGYVGRIVQEQKRVLDLVPLALELVRRRVCFELYIIGEGPERRILETALEQEGLAGSVKLLGWLSPARVNEELRKLDVFVLLSEYEGLPVALLEAMGKALAPVVTRTESGNTQLVQDGKNGFIVDVGDISAFGQRLQLLANDRQRLLLTGRAAWETSQHYSLERMGENYVESFQNAAGKAAERQQREGLSSRYPVMPSCRSKYPAWLRKIKRRVVSLVSPNFVGTTSDTQRSGGSSPSTQVYVADHPSNR